MNQPLYSIKTVFVEINGIHHMELKQLKREHKAKAIYDSILGINKQPMLLSEYQVKNYGESRNRVDFVPCETPYYYAFETGLLQD